MNSLDLLLSIDNSKISRPTKEVELKRLTKLTGDKVIFKLQGLTANEYNDILEQSAGKDNVNVADTQALVIINGVVSPDLKDKKLLDKFDVPTPKLLIQKLLMPGEIVRLYQEISKLSGFADDTVSDLKNE